MRKKIIKKPLKLILENKRLKQDNEEYLYTIMLEFKRPYAKRYLEELRKETPNLLYPDSETIYKDYYDLRDRIDRANNFIDQVIMYAVKPEDYNKVEMLQDILNNNKFGSDNH